MLIGNNAGLMPTIPLHYTKRYLFFHNMVWFYVIYRYVISEWISIRPVEINQYDITMATHYDITIGNDIAKDVHCKIAMVMMLLGTSIVMSQWVVT